jgi:hypothetical protein
MSGVKYDQKKEMKSVLFPATPRKRASNTLLTGKQTAVPGRTAERTSETHVE